MLQFTKCIASFSKTWVDVDVHRDGVREVTAQIGEPVGLDLPAITVTVEAGDSGYDWDIGLRFLQADRQTDAFGSVDELGEQGL